MQRLTRILFLAAAACTSGGAAAQSADDCDRAPFPLRGQPHSIVDRAARADAGEPASTVTGVIFARCEAGPTKLFVCGVTARRLRSGHLGEERRFFGVYDAGKFTVTAVGRFAENACKTKVYR
ncbi:hypothetical protein [Bosea sp. PAMC 26642]|uniref:hypothetical protein n=1 Tax=Bosea sp. (strain PAMC 26642) TaxID=1792307 RepID=UPI0007702A2F|nr:hypothetical protein [Bosea sp. PAMC 26642]AMJ62770.1 hypothetical protein AXW83_22945 [Bosea sp. PAMC 26642]